ncbi:MAG: hypothetical protein KFF49_10610 [Bacteroidales bacterium]|nr:hypothetical protein [Bacteroidales bacterium]
MTTERKNTGFAIALAWPQTFCKEPGSWYDPLTRWMGISRNNYYKAGHAAVVLVDTEQERCHYFDFGRYHAPLKYGRVRSEATDHDLKINTIPEISGDGKSILNFHEILEELQHNPACHGEGILKASYCPINFDSAIKKAMQMQVDSPIPYGPFIRGGSNCSRFVNTIILAGTPAMKYRLKLKYLLPSTPTPLNNVSSLSRRTIVPVLRKTIPFTPVRPLTRSELISTLPAPARHPSIPENAQWLSGEGAGSWFAFESEKEVLKVTRFAPDGTLECSGFYKGSVRKLPEVGDSFIVDYPSNCMELNLKYSQGQLIFRRIS